MGSKVSFKVPVRQYIYNKEKLSADQPGALSPEVRTNAGTALNNYENAQPKDDDELLSAELIVNNLTLGYVSEWQHYVWEGAKGDNVVLQLLDVPTQKKT